VLASLHEARLLTLGLVALTPPSHLQARSAHSAAALALVHAKTITAGVVEAARVGSRVFPWR